MPESEPLFLIEHPHLRRLAVRVGDLLRVRNLDYGWKDEGKIVMVLGVVDAAFTRFVPADPDDLFPSDVPEECFVIIDGRRDTMRIEYLEAIVD
jgi:hypothetical protein